MKILSIGNSFSDDAQRYLHAIAASEGVEIETLNVCIGGCSLETHAAHVKDGAKAYLFHYNGDVNSSELVTLDEGLSMREWDVVTLQQVSTESFEKESFRSAAFFTASDRPCDEPITKHISFDIENAWSIFCASSSEENCFPSTQRATL